MTSPSAAMMKDDSGDMLLSAKTMIGTTILPRKESVIIPNITKDNEERERKEKEREDRLKKKKENSILNYTLVHKGGIAVTEKKKHGKKVVNAQNKNSKNQGEKTNVTRKNTGLLTVKKKRVEHLSTENVKTTNKKTAKRKSQNALVQTGKKHVG